MAIPTPTNGTHPGGRRRVHAVPKTITFEVEVLRDGTPTFVEMTGYHRERCPVWVSIEVDAARDEYVAAAFVDKEITDPLTNEPTIVRDYQYSRDVEARYRAAVLVAVVKGLQDDEAAVLLSSGDGMEMLADLGWFTRPSEQNEQETPTDPEVEGAGETQAAPTGAASSPARRRSTAASTS